MHKLGTPIKPAVSNKTNKTIDRRKQIDTTDKIKAADQHIKTHSLRLNQTGGVPQPKREVRTMPTNKRKYLINK